MSTGYLALVLHAHLPFVRHPEDETVMEEAWLYEAITETYLPLLRVFEGLVHDRVPFRLTVSLSAPLLSMLVDPLLQERYSRHLERLQDLAEREIRRTREQQAFARLAHFYRDRLHDLAHTWNSHGGNLVPAFRRLQDAGCLEVITSTATHGFFPLLDRNWPVLRAQVQVAAQLYETHFGRSPLGMWLGECGYEPGVDALLRDQAIRYFLVDAHGIENADPRPLYGNHAPLYCQSGVAAFGRDRESSQQVWSSKAGYPGEPCYRDFYRDIGFDLPLEELGLLRRADDIRTYTGFKYHAITHEQLHDKQVYDPTVARGKCGLHATHFREQRRQQLEQLAAHMDRPPLIVSPYDAELYGHWWFEGPQFLDDVLRQMHFDQEAVELVTPGDYLARHATNQYATPSASSWGHQGYNDYWLSESNAWIYPHLHHAGERMVGLAERFPDAAGLTRRALDQAARELLLAQSSDWAFIMRTGTTVGYAERRTNEHVQAFRRLDQDLCENHIDETWLTQRESRYPLFPDLDYRVYTPDSHTR